MSRISGFEPRDYQVETVYQSLKEYRKTIVSPTGSGKSMMIYAIARYLAATGKRTLIVVPTKMLVEQMTKDFAEYGWNTDDNVHKIYQGHSLDTKSPVTVSTFQSIYGLPKKWFAQFDAVIGDECHNFKAKVLQGIMKKCPDAKWRYGFTEHWMVSKSTVLFLKAFWSCVPNHNFIRTNGQGLPCQIERDPYT